MAINNFINLDREDALTEPKALIIALYNASDNEEVVIRLSYKLLSLIRL